MGTPANQMGQLAETPEERSRRLAREAVVPAFAQPGGDPGPGPAALAPRPEPGPAPNDVASVQAPPIELDQGMAGAPQGPAPQQALGQGLPPDAAPGAMPSGAALSQPEQAPAPGQGEAKGGEDPIKTKIQALEPEQLKELTDDAAEATKTASVADRKNVNDELMEMYGGPEKMKEAREELIELLGGNKAVEPYHLTKQDWGLFMMDFGMRMMAYSSRWNSTVLGAAGQAGVETLGQIMNKVDEEQQITRDMNAAAEGRADEMMDEQADHMRKMEMEVEKSRLAGGVHGKQTDFQRKFRLLTTVGGMSERMAILILAAGAESPDELRAGMAKLFADPEMRSQRLTPPGEPEGVRLRDWDDKQQKAYTEAFIKSIWGDEYQGPGGRPALSEPPPQPQPQPQPQPSPTATPAPGPAALQQSDRWAPR